MRASSGWARGPCLMIEVHRLHLTDITPTPNLPWTRPTFPVFGYLIAHPAGPIVIDTGVGTNNKMINKLYSPVHHDLDEALRRHGVRVEDVHTVITSHLHFDHCGQNYRFRDSRIFVQRAEIEAAREPLYTVPEWAFPEKINLTAIDGDLQVADGVRIISTPGHTPGHQSVLIEDESGTRTIVCCQASWNTQSFDEGTLGDDGWDQEIGVRSLEKLRALDPDRVVLSHDVDEWHSPCSGFGQHQSAFGALDDDAR
jgi:N-acyl homoserine lactone hydrolase